MLWGPVPACLYLRFTIIYIMRTHVSMAFQAEIGVRPRFFCYPGGRYDAAVLPILQQVGIVAAVTTEAGTLHVSDRPLELKRARMRGTTTVYDLAWMVNDWWQ